MHGTINIKNLELLTGYKLTQLFETEDQFVRLNHICNYVNRRKTLSLKLKFLKIPTEAVRTLLMCRKHKYLQCEQVLSCA